MKKTKAKATASTLLEGAWAGLLGGFLGFAGAAIAGAAFAGVHGRAARERFSIPHSTPSPCGCSDSELLAFGCSCKERVAVLRATRPGGDTIQVIFEEAR